MSDQLTDHLKLDRVLFSMVSFTIKWSILAGISFVLERLDEVIFNILDQSQFCRIKSTLSMDNLIHYAWNLQFVAIDRFFTFFLIIMHLWFEDTSFVVLDEDMSIELLNWWALLWIGIETFLDEADKLGGNLLFQHFL